MGDIAYVRKKGGVIARTAYNSGWRPTIRMSLRAACPEITALIEEMWLKDFRARPAMNDVVVRLEACTFVGGVTIDDQEEVSALLSSTLAEDKDENADQTKTEDTLRAKNMALVKAFRAARLEIAQLKAALLAGSSTEHDDDFGILGGMFICTSNTWQFLTLRPLKTQTHPAINRPHS